VTDDPFRYRDRPEDFVVEELVAEPPGEAEDGTHVWFTVEKRGVSTPAAARRIARALGRRGGDVSFAGRKDAVAWTRQRMSVEHVDPDALMALELEGVSVSEPRRQRRKLRPGELRGNRFELVLRGVDGAAVPRMEGALAVLGRDGMPNPYGEQRFGAGGLELARRLVHGTAVEYLAALADAAAPAQREAAAELVRRVREGSQGERRRAAELCPSLPLDLVPVARQLARRRPDDPAELLGAVPRTSRAFHLAILQGAVFNDVLGRRLAEGTAAAALEGDVVLRDDGRHGHVSLEHPAEGAVPCGPMWAPGLAGAMGRPGEVERAAFEAEGLAPEAPARPGGLQPRGSRRPLFVPVGAPALRRLEEGEDGLALRVTFDLPPGSYATALLDRLREACLEAS